MIEKILERLDEASERYEDIGFAEIGNNGHTLDFEYAKGKMEGIVEAISIIQEVAEEYNNGWIPVEARLPEHNIDVEVTLSNGQRHICWYSGLRQEWIDTISDDESELNVIAWKEPSEPYQKGE